jgi:hypothetical protein
MASPSSQRPLVHLDAWSQAAVEELFSLPCSLSGVD